MWCACGVIMAMPDARSSLLCHKMIMCRSCQSQLSLLPSPTGSHTYQQQDAVGCTETLMQHTWPDGVRMRPQQPELPDSIMGGSVITFRDAADARGCRELGMSEDALRVIQGRRAKMLRLDVERGGASRPAAARPCGQSTFISACWACAGSSRQGTDESSGRKALCVFMTCWIHEVSSIGQAVAGTRC